jgi:hypothetical protein
VVLSQDKEALLERYQIIRGEKELLQKIPRELFIAVRRHRHGFEAMTENYEQIKACLNLTDQVARQQATLEDLMYYFSKRSQLDE